MDFLKTNYVLFSYFEAWNKSFVGYRKGDFFFFYPLY